MTAPENIIDVSVANFETGVIQASSQRPVLVSLGSSRSELCMTLTPLLDKLAREMNGSFLLARVDVDQNPEIAQAFRVQSVPTVILIVDGQPLDAFAGAKSEPELREFLAAHIQPGAGLSPLPQAQELAAAGQLPEAKSLVESWLDENEDDGEARAALAGWLLDEGDPESAQAHYDQLLPDARESAAARSVAARLELLQNAGDIGELEQSLEENPRDIALRIELGKALVAGAKTEEGLEQLLEAAMRDMQFEDGAPRKALIEVFQAIGPADPLTLEFQQRLSVLLCS